MVSSLPFENMHRNTKLSRPAEQLKSTTRTYWVKPDVSIRTTNGIFPLPVQGTDLVFWGVRFICAIYLRVLLIHIRDWQLPQLHILPGPLDIPKAKDTLSKTLAYFPHASGVLRRNGNKWWVSTVNSHFNYNV
jgi:hypothetical protein